MITDHDIVMVGGGGAGLRAAIAIAETNPSLSVAVVSKVYPMRSHTVAAEGGAAAVIKDNDSLEHHINDTIAGGDWMCDQDAVELFVNEAPRELMQMDNGKRPKLKALSLILGIEFYTIDILRSILPYEY